MTNKSQTSNQALNLHGLFRKLTLEKQLGTKSYESLQKNCHAWMVLINNFSGDEFEKFMTQDVITDEVNRLMENIERTMQEKTADLGSILARLIKALNDNICKKDSKNKIDEIVNATLVKAKGVDSMSDKLLIGAYISITIAIAIPALLIGIFPATLATSSALFLGALSAGLILLALGLGMAGSIIKYHNNTALNIDKAKDDFFNGIEPSGLKK